jgi:hypothetical protein
MKSFRYSFSFVLIALLTLTAATAWGQATVTPATGGTTISADNTGSATWTTLTGPVITETTPNQIQLGTIVLNAPSGFVFNTGATVTATVTTGDLSLTSSSITPTS